MLEKQRYQQRDHEALAAGYMNILERKKEKAEYMVGCRRGHLGSQEEQRWDAKQETM